MAKLIYEKRQFKDRTGVNIEYEAYELHEVVQGEKMILPLGKTLSPAEKIAFKIMASETVNDELNISSLPADEETKEKFRELNKKSDKGSGSLFDNDEIEEMGL